MERVTRPFTRFARRRPRVALVATVAALVTGIGFLPIGREAPVFAAYHHVVDELGVRLVEGHAEALHAAALESRVSATLLAAIVYAESRGRGGQTSRTGALGLGQLMPAAASDAAKRLGIPPQTPERVRDDDRLNLRLAAAHLGWLVERSQGWPLEQLLVSYNAGRSRMFTWVKREGSFEAWCRAEERRAARGEPTTGSLAYARQVLAIRARLRDRGVIRDAPGLAAP